MSYGTLAADGATTPESVQGYVWLHTQGTFGGGTLTLQYLSGDGTYRPITPSAVTAAGDYFVSLPGPAQVRVSLAGAIAPSLFYEIQHGYRK